MHTIVARALLEGIHNVTPGAYIDTIVHPTEGWGGGGGGGSGGGGVCMQMYMFVSCRYIVEL